MISTVLGAEASVINKMDKGHLQMGLPFFILQFQGPTQEQVSHISLHPLLSGMPTWGDMANWVVKSFFNEVNSS